MTEKTPDLRPVVLLDLDNTILDFNTAERRALGRAFAEFGLPFSDEIAALYNSINLRHWEMLEDGILTRQQVLVRRFEALYRELGIPGDADRTQALYESLLAEGHWFMPGAVEMLQKLSGRYRLFICSNGTQRVQDGRIESAGIAPYFEKIFVSEHMGSNKPERQYFERCFREIPDFKRSNAIILGDSLTSDIRGGKNAEILTCWYNPKGKQNPGPIFPDYEIRALSEFEGLLQRVFG
jgi:HAD superfamily (subfamily IA) hydrolase, TIGR02254